MSEGPRLPWLWMRRAAERLVERWGMQDLLSRGDLLIGGSIRRQKHYCGDIDLTMPLPASGADDRLYATLYRSLGPPPGKADGLFADVVPAGKDGWWLKGLKPGFHACELVAALEGGPCGEVDYTGTTFRIPVQVHRWAPDNRGWIELLRTGPLEFTQRFLVRWRRIHEMSGEQQASREGFLRNHDNAPVATPTEMECFTRCRLRYVKPEDRQTFHWKVLD